MSNGGEAAGFGTDLGAAGPACTGRARSRPGPVQFRQSPRPMPWSRVSRAAL